MDAMSTMLSKYVDDVIAGIEGVIPMGTETREGCLAAASEAQIRVSNWVLSVQGFFQDQ